MIRPGLCSITFRSLSPDDVLTLAVKAGVEGIEWGADVHALPGGAIEVAALGRRCRDAGVAVASYGSYLGAGPAGDDVAADSAVVEAVLDSAEALGAPMVRIWTEFGVVPHSDPADRERVAERTSYLADAAAVRGLAVALEFHPGTLTHTAASTNALLDVLSRPNLRTHWQPDPSLSPEEALAELRSVAPRLAHLHTFWWGPGGVDERLALADGAALWPAAFDVVDVVDAAAPPLAGTRFALLEYVCDDDPDQFLSDAAALRGWLDTRSNETVRP